MDKFKKVGLSALAGSLVAFSAQAIEWGVSGGAEITIVHNDSDEVTGNPIGARKNIGFSASGELDNGMGISVGHYMNDALTLGSSVYTFDMGSAGSVTLDYGAGGFGADEIDNVMPTAYEEADDGFATGISKIGANYSGHYLSYKNNFGGFTFGGSYNPSIGGGASGDGAAGGNDGGKGIDMFFRVSPIDGLNWCWCWYYRRCWYNYWF
jgi:outer membrane protein OmpU